MPPFPMNSLPAEFQEEHGSLTLDGDETDSKPQVNTADYDGDDEDLDISQADQRVWLCKVSPISIAPNFGSRRVGDVEVREGLES